MLLRFPFLFFAVVQVIPQYHNGGLVLHDGGDVVYAHEGLGMYKGRREVPAVLTEGEQVIQPEVASLSSPQQWDNFRATGDPGALNGGGGKDITMVVYEPGPLTRVMLTDRQVVPRTDERNRYNIKSSI